LSTTFIIDLYFSGIILAGLAASVVWARSRVPARVGLVALAGYVALQFVLQQQAVDFGREYARREGVRAARVSAEPRPVSPFNWMVIVGDAERYHYSLVNLVRRTPPAAPGPESGLLERLGAPYLPLDQAIWVQAERWGSGPQRALAREAFEQPQFAFFRWFAAYPALLRTDTTGTQDCAWFHDLRFFTPGRDNWPFRFGMCRLAGGGWHPYQLVGEKPLPL
jgi:inner membrane protein